MSERRDNNSNSQGANRGNKKFSSGGPKQRGSFSKRGGGRDNRNNYNRPADGKPLDAPSEPRKREINFDLAKHLNKKILVAFVGGRKFFGILKGYDPLLNVVLDEAEEYIIPRLDVGEDEAESTFIDLPTRKIGLCVGRGNNIAWISPFEIEEVADPFS